MQCTAKSKRSGRQCERYALRGYTVCPMHGAGGRKRVMEGKRKSPRLASIKTGEHTTPDTERERKILDLGYVRTLQEIEQNPQLAELDEMAKRIYASMRSVSQIFDKPEERDQALKSIACAIAQTEQDRSWSRDRKLMEAMVKVFVEYIPRDQVQAAGQRFWDLAGDVFS